MAVRRQEQLATLPLWSMFLFASLLATFLLLSMFVWFGSLAYLAGRAAAVSDDIETARESNLFRTEPDRCLTLEFVKGTLALAHPLAPAFSFPTT